MNGPSAGPPQAGPHPLGGSVGGYADRGAVRYRKAAVGGAVSAALEVRADGIQVLRSTEPLGDYPERITDRLERWAREVPERTFVAKRLHGADWRRISYAEMLARAQAVGQALVNRGLSAERPLVILSDNDLEHLTLVMGALWVGVPHATISSAYSVIAQDYSKLRHIVNTLKPGLVFASHGAPYARAIQACLGSDVEVVLTDDPRESESDGRKTTRFDTLLDTPLSASGAAAHARVNADTIAKFMFTSGSTKHPKGVVVTQRMWCANQQMLRQCMAFLAEEPPVLVDWLPWNHTFGGNHNVGITLYNGGTLYIDDGKPTPKGIAETLRNLREIQPTVYFNVPKGFDEIAAAMTNDAALRESVFKRVQAFMCGGAGISQASWNLIDRHAEATVGERIRIIGGLGMTETAPSCTFVLGTDARAGFIGLPCPGVEVKLVPLGDKTEVRFRGPNVMPGYWRDAENTAQAFDEEGFYCTGDAVTWVDPQDHSKGLMFDGRIAEDFKLSTATFVSVGPLKASIVTLGAPLVQDAVITGLNRDEVGALVFPRVEECRQLAGLSGSAPANEVLRHPKVTAFFQTLADKLWQAGTGSANRVVRLHAMSEPPSIDKGEITDKGSINQRNVLTHRAALVEALYDGSVEGLILPRRT